MISSTRSSESASRSSWKDASSVTSASSTPSCSTSTSLTRSKTSSREAAMSPLLAVGFSGSEDANTLLRGIHGQTVAEPGDDSVLDTARCKSDRVGDRAARGVAMSDDDEAPQPEEIRPSVGLRVEAGPEAPGGRADEQSADLAARTLADFVPQPVEHRA